MAETPSFSVKPSATPIAKISGRLPKITSPEFFIRSDRISGIQPKFGGADTQQQACHRQHGDRQHQGLADLLKEGESILEHDFRNSCWLLNQRYSAKAASRARTCSAVPSASTSSARAWHSDRESLPMAALIAGIVGHGDGKLLDAEPDQDRDRDQVGRDAAADADPFAVLRGAVGRQLDHAQDGRVQAVGLAGQLGMAAVHRQRVLGQVVGADREEVASRREDVGHGRRRRALRP